MPKIATNFEVGSAQPIDTRFVVQSESDLANLKVYEGLEVYIKDLKAKRLYNGTGWVEVTSGASAEDVMNIIEENGAEVEQDYSIGTSSNYDATNDKQLVTAKAVKSMIGNTNTGSNTNNIEIKKNNGWLSSIVPISGYIENIYVNTNLSIEEVETICKNLTFAAFGDYDMAACCTDNTLSNGLAIMKYYLNGEKTDIAYVINFNKNGIPTILFSNKVVEGVTTNVGWQENFNGIIELNMNNQLALVGPYLGYTPENEKMITLFSSTPFVLDIETIEINGEYQGITIENDENSIIDITEPLKNKQFPLKFKINLKEVQELINRVNILEDKTNTTLYVHAISITIETGFQIYITLLTNNENEMSLLDIKEYCNKHRLNVNANIPAYGRRTTATSGNEILFIYRYISFTDSSNDLWVYADRYFKKTIDEQEIWALTEQEYKMNYKTVISVKDTVTQL